jgi:hypothetical protein
VSKLEVWAVYASPDDFPGQYVVRRFLTGEDGVRATSEGWRGRTLAEVREPLIRRGLHQMDRLPDDHAHIVETWF